jgi:hypothetical protein
VRVAGVRWLDFDVCERVEKLGIVVDNVCITGGEVLGLTLNYAQIPSKSCG